ncbi:hemolysin family protein [Longimicrobium sp.]|uniref:hemolysin family protein n=1 Tax=Longimicrobium sp. TaxID=2029185 RepID=UPI002BFB0BE2|nr:hemolysin family protein [Longimicrobium sp.]HSU14185.1 hemolysin family protein [Longimicrobium sp.]
MDKLLTVLIVFVLVMLNAVFVAAEFAIVSVPHTTMERRAAQGDRLARMVVRVLKDAARRDRYIATAQLGISVASLLLGMYGEHALAEWLAAGLHALGMGEWRYVTAHGLASFLALVILTYFHIVLGEMIPKSISLQAPDRTSRLVTPVLLGVQTVALPLIRFLSFAGNGLLRVFGIDRTELSNENVRTPEELRYIVRESQAGGMLRRESAAVVQELLDFGDLTAGEVMVPRVRVTGLKVGTPFDEVVRIVRRHPHTRYPVYRDDLDHIVGMVHIKDLFRRLRARRAVHEHDAREVPFVPETADIDDVMKALRAARTQMAVVMDEHGGTAGIVTIEDLFEEVVGDIEESATRRPEMYRDDRGRAIVAGTVRVEEVGEFLGVVLEHEEVDSVSGLVLDLLGRPPAVGDVVEYDDVRFEVTAVEGHGVREAAATLLKPPKGPPMPAGEEP